MRVVRLLALILVKNLTFLGSLSVVFIFSLTTLQCLYFRALFFELARVKAFVRPKRLDYTSLLPYICLCVKSDVK